MRLALSQMATASPHSATIFIGYLIQQATAALRVPGRIPTVLTQLLDYCTTARELYEYKHQHDLCTHLVHPLVLVILV